MRRHYFAMLALPVCANVVICDRCGKRSKIGEWPTGKRSKCSGAPRRPYVGRAGLALGKAAR